MTIPILFEKIIKKKSLWGLVPILVGMEMQLNIRVKDSLTGWGSLLYAPRWKAGTPHTHPGFFLSSSVLGTHMFLNTYYYIVMIVHRCASRGAAWRASVCL